jgi:signal transduction histidine kinase
VETPSTAPARWSSRARLGLLACAIAGTAVTAGVLVLPPLALARFRPGLHLLLEALAGFVGLLVVYLLAGRLTLSRRSADAWLMFGLALLAVANVTESASDAIGGVAGDTRDWGLVAVRLIGVAALTAAAHRRPDLVVRARHPVATVIGASLAVAGALLAAERLLAGRLPEVVASVEAAPAGADLPAGHPVLLVVQALSALLFAAAAWGFLRRAEATGDRLMPWLAASTTLLVFASASYVLFPSLYTSYVSNGDLLRVAAYLVLLVGATAEIRRNWRGAADAAVAEERRKIARDLHDGLAQELGFVATQVRQLQRRPEVNEVAGRELSLLASASRRALDESRRAIDLLASPMDEPVDEVIARTAETVAARAGARVKLDLEPGIALDRSLVEHLVRITREGVSNAVRHGEATAVTVALSTGDGLVRLEIRDDGRGFDPAIPHPGLRTN